jgi:prepilin-type N-terminal cleavage/methylation domain-containing protein
MNTTRQDVRGFSLLEIMVVMAVFGILLAIAAPSVVGYVRSSRLAGATNTLMADLYQTRALANAQRKTYTIVFQPGAYRVNRVSPASTMRTRQLPPGVSVAATGTATFYAWGLATPVVITMANCDGSKGIRLAANGSVTHD